MPGLRRRSAGFRRFLGSHQALSRSISIDHLSTCRRRLSHGTVLSWLSECFGLLIGRGCSFRNLSGKSVVGYMTLALAELEHCNFFCCRNGRSGDFCDRAVL